MIKKNKIQYIVLVVFTLLAVSCDSLLDPEDDNRFTNDTVIDNPVFAEGWLLKAYANLPTNYNFNIDVASDDAENNNPGLNIHVMNSGGWASNFNPLGSWGQAYEMNLYINTLLENVDLVTWFPSSTEKDALFRDRIKGELYGLRAWWNFQLLQSHSGVGSNGQLLGFPIVENVLSSSDDFKLPRNTFKECVDFIIEDCNLAIAKLPVKWEDQGLDPEVDAVLGARNLNRINGISAMLIKSRVALYAASPSYQETISWETAAQYAADVITANGGLNLNSSDVTFYENFQSSEILWASSRITNKSNWEADNFPPSLFGNGRTNPTQNFVDAFPMIDGTPIELSGDFSPTDPFSQRDPRLERHVIYNGQNFSGNTINTYVNSGIDGIDATQTSTITGYYLKKFIDPDVNLDPGGVTSGVDHFYTYARFTEALLNFAEAANEVGGPEHTVNGYTPRLIINAIRTRGGITSTAYVDGINGASQMRELIRNERRIELSFEGNRFWDLRRWGLTNTIKEPALGLRISESQTEYDIFEVAPRNYQDFQLYGPVPLAETQKYDLIQNIGWQ